MNRLIAVAATLALAGCASTSPAPAFRDTAQLVATRTGQRLVWNQGTSADAAVAKSVRALLSRELTVDAAVQIALVNNRDLQATYEDLSVAQADLVQAGLLENPVFGVGVVFPIAGAVQRGFTLSIVEDFLGLFTLAARKRIAQSELEAAELRVADGVLRVAYDVQSTFFRLQCARQVAAMRRTISQAGDAALDLGRRQREAGNINDLDLANQEGLYEQVRTDLVRSEGDVLTAQERLTRLMGLWGPDAAYRVAEKLPELPETEVPLEHMEAVAIARRLDLRAAHAEAQAVSHALALTKNYRWLGSPSVGATYERSPEGFSVLGPEASVELPIFDQKQAAVARLEGQLRAALSRETALAVTIRSEVREARGRLLASRAIVERYAQVIVPLRERAVALSQQQHDAMLLGVYQLIQAKQSEVNAYREFIETLRDYWSARVDLERATGGALAPTAPRTRP